MDKVILSDDQKKLLFWQCIRSKQFWVIYSMQGLSILFAYYCVNVYKLFGEEVPALDDDAYLTLVNSVSAIFNALRFIWSGSIDKIPFRYVYGTLLLIQITIAFTMTLTEKSKVSYMTVMCLVLFCVGGHFALFPNVIRQIFGKQATFLYGWCFTGTGIASMMIEALILSKFGKNYIIMFCITGSGSLISLALLLLMFEQKRFEPDWTKIFYKSMFNTQQEECKRTNRVFSIESE